MSMNTAVFYVDWKDLQVPFRNPNAGNTIYVANAGQARSYGIEWEWSFRPSEALELNASLMVGKAEISKDTPFVPSRAASARGPALSGVTKGMRLPGAPEVTGSIGVQYNLPEMAGGEPYIRVDSSYVGSSYIDLEKTGSLKIGDFNNTNIRLGYKFGNYEIVAFANNIFNSREIVNATSNANRLLLDAAIRQRPRVIGLDLRANF